MERKDVSRKLSFILLVSFSPFLTFVRNKLHSTFPQYVFLTPQYERYTQVSLFSSFF